MAVRRDIARGGRMVTCCSAARAPARRLPGPAAELLPSLKHVCAHEPEMSWCLIGTWPLNTRSR